MQIDIELQLRGPLAYHLLTEASRNGEEPVTLLARSVERMIKDGKLDTAENSQLPCALNIKSFWLASALSNLEE
jgi:hypothetical protein